MARKRVLIVEDEATVRLVIREVLERSGYELAEAADGTEGLAKAERFRPDVILLDVVLPGLDGSELCRRLKANPATNQIPVIFLTGVEDDVLYSLASEVGAVACISKPFHMETLEAVVEGALDSAERRAKPEGRHEGEGP